MKPTAILLKLLPLLLVLCMLFTSCVTTPGGDNGTGTGETDSHTHEEGETTGEPETEEDTTVDGTEGDTTGDDTTVTSCTHASTKVTGQLDATCGTVGYTGNTVCTACGDLISEGTTIPATGNHTWGVEEVTKTPTCIAEGESTQYCTVCHTATKKTPIPTVAHKDDYHIITGNDQTHILGCKTCDKSESQAHQPVNSGTTVPATCTEDAYTLLHCSLCQADYKVTQAGTAIGHHTWGSWYTSKEVSCAEDGENRRDCELCDEFETAVVPKATALHELKRVSYTAATCKNEGAEELTCACGTHTETKVLNKIAHKYQETSNDGEWIISTCLACDNTVSQYIATEKTADITVSEIPAEKPFEINLGGTKIEFPTEIVDAMKESGTGSSFKAETVDDKTSILESSTLNDSEKASIEAGEIYNFEAPVSDFGDTTVKITMPYTLDGDQDPDAIVIWYIDENNTLTKVEDVAYDADTQTVTFEVAHFSYYAIVYHETQELKCSKGDHGDNLEVIQTVAATCYSNGYTVKECKVCHRTLYTDYQDREAHAWGELIPFVPQHCGDSGYSKKICSKCETEQLIKFFPATGHKAMPATCTEDSVCSICKNVVSSAKGHSWGEWVTVKEPTDVEKGLKRRNCPDCGEEEFVTLAATGNITELVFTSYQDLAEYLLHNVLGFEDGKITLSVTAEGQRTELTVMLDVNGASYTMLIEGTVTDLANPQDPDSKEELDYAFRVLYRNGVIVFAEDGENAYYNLTDLDSLLTGAFDMDVDTFLAVLEEMFDSYVNPYFEYGYGEASETLDELLAICGAELDAYFKENEIDFTTQKLKDTLKSIENVYVYVALKMGYDTNLEWQGMELPSRADLVNILEAFCTKTTDAAGNTSYAFDGDGEIAAAIDAIYTWLKENADKKLNDLLFELYKEDILTILPEAKSWEDVAEFIDAEFGGEMTAKALIEKLIAADALDTVYVTVDYMVNKLMGTDESFSCEAWLVNNSTLTLNELCTNQFGTSWDNMRTMFSQMLDVTLADLKVSTPGGDLPLIEMLMMIKTAYIDRIDIALADLEVVVNAEGEMISLKLNALVNLLVPEENDSNNNHNSDSIDRPAESYPSIDVNGKVDYNTVITSSTDGKIQVKDNVTESNGNENEAPTMTKVQLFDISFAIDRTAVTIELPSDLSSLAGGKVSYTYDTEGNLIISGLNKDIDYEIDVSGNRQEMELKDVVIRDEAMSAELGYDVYVLKEQYWVEIESAGDYLLGPDGKYYTYAWQYEPSYTGILNQLLLKDIITNPNLLLPTEGEASVGAYGNSKVYSCELGNIYQADDGVWQLIDHNSSKYSIKGDDKNDVYTRLLIYDYVECAPLFEVAASLELSNGRPNEGYIQSEHPIYQLNFNASGFDRTISVYAYIQGDDIYCVETGYIPSNEYLILGEALDTLPDFVHSYTNIEDRPIYDVQGNPVEGKFKRIHIECYVPTYYTCFDGKYFPIGKYEGSMFVKIQNIEAITDGTVDLGGGKVLYLLGSIEMNRYYDGSFVTQAKVGYIKVKDDLYIGAVCFYDGDQLIKLYYQNTKNEYLYPMGDTVISVALSSLANLDGITRLADGSYVIPKAVLDTLRATLDEPGDAFCFLISALYKNADGTDINEFYFVGTEATLPEISFGGSYQDESESSLYLGEFFANKSDGMGGYDITANGDGSFTVTFKTGKEIQVEYQGNSPVINVQPDMLTKNEEMSAQTGLEIYDMLRYETFESDFVKIDGKYYNYSTEEKRIVSQYQEGTLLEILKRCGRFTDISRFTPMDAPASIKGEVLYIGYLMTLERQYKFLVPVYFKLENGELKVLTGVDNSSAIFTYEGTTTLSAYLDSLTLVKQGSEATTARWQMPDGSTVYVEQVILKDGDRSIGNYPAHYYLANGEKCYIGVEELEYRYSLVVGENLTKPTFIESEETWIGEYENGSFVEGRFVSYSITTEQYVKVAGKYYDFVNDINDRYGYTFKERVTLEENFMRNTSTEYAVWYYYNDEGNRVYVKIDSYNGNGTVNHVPFDEMGEGWYITDDIYNYYKDAEGREIIETRALVPEEYSVADIDANTKYLYFPSRGMGYIACTTTDGVYYFEAEAMTDKEGNVSYTLRNVETTARLNSTGELDCLNSLKKLMVIDGNAVTFTKEFMKLFEGRYENYLYFNFYVVNEEGWNTQYGQLNLNDLLDRAENDEQYPDKDDTDYEQNFNPTVPDDSKDFIEEDSKASVKEESKN